MNELEKKLLKDRIRKLRKQVQDYEQRSEEATDVMTKRYYDDLATRRRDRLNQVMDEGTAEGILYDWDL